MYKRQLQPGLQPGQGPDGSGRGQATQQAEQGVLEQRVRRAQKQRQVEAEAWGREPGVIPPPPAVGLLLGLSLIAHQKSIIFRREFSQLTGAGGLISNGVAGYLKQKDRNIEIIGVSPVEGNIEHFDTIIQCRFGERLDIPPGEYDLVLHCAFDKDDKSNEMNTRGTLEWVASAEKAGIKKQVFLSSISSQSGYLSPYGKSKKELEHRFLEKGYIVFRLGLVIANGGMFGRLLSSLFSSPVIPLIGGGKFLVFPTNPGNIYDLVFRIFKGNIRDNAGKPWNLQYRSGITLRELLNKLSLSIGRKVTFLPIPYSLIYPVVKVVSLLRIPGIDIDTGNLKGLKWNSRLSLRSDLEYLGYEEKPLDELFRNLRR